MSNVKKDETMIRLSTEKFLSKKLIFVLNEFREIIFRQIINEMFCFSETNLEDGSKKQVRKIK